jgi:hypothetical protein
MTREEHLAECKRRAREYLDRHDVKNGVTSMLSDLSKHPETRDLSGGGFAMIGMMMIMENDLAGARRFVEGFR